MSIFNLQSLLEQATTKKKVIAEKKSEKIENIEENKISTEPVFVTTIREVEDIANKVDANIAYDESLPEETNNPNLFKNMILDYMKTFTDINESLREKCLAFKPSLDILKERLYNIEDIGNKKIISVTTMCQYTNLGYLKEAANVKTLINQQLGMRDREMESFEPIKYFRQSIRYSILGIEGEIVKSDYILGLYKMFRNTEAVGLDIDKAFLVDNLLRIYQFPVLYNHDIKVIYDFLDEISKQDITANDIITKRVEIILQEYSLLYSARADAIIEFTDQLREYLSLYVEAFGGGEEDE